MIKFWKYYDSLREPKRFFFAILMCLPIIVGSFFIQNNLYVGLSLILLEGVLIISRVFYQIKNTKNEI